jgi:hypothetical protein
MVILDVYCIWCGEHRFRVDRATVDAAKFMVLTCPACDKKMTLHSAGGGLRVLPDTPEQMNKPASQESET